MKDKVKCADCTTCRWSVITRLILLPTLRGCARTNNKPRKGMICDNYDEKPTYGFRKSAPAQVSGRGLENLGYKHTGVESKHTSHYEKDSCTIEINWLSGEYAKYDDSYTALNIELEEHREIKRILEGWFR